MSQKKVAVMQPYLFPYLGYFQLIKSADIFVFYDDVNYMKQGWINRNNILQNGQAMLFTVPLKKASSFDVINEVQINQTVYKKWLKKFWRTIEQSYYKAPFYNDIIPLLLKIFHEDHFLISEKAIDSIKLIIDYLNLEKVFYISSKSFGESKGMERADRLIHIINNFEAKDYINPSGGKELYQKEYFEERGVNLYFINNRLKEYKQFKNEFVSGLSMIDVLMFNSKEDVRKMLTDYELQ